MNIEKNTEKIEKYRVIAMLDYLYKHLDTMDKDELKSVIINYKNFTNNHCIDQPTDIKPLKGYIFDSLTYRYIRAREQMAEYEFMRDEQSNVSNHTEWTVYRERANRDIMRFIQILEEAIGEHD